MILTLCRNHRDHKLCASGPQLRGSDRREAHLQAVDFAKRVLWTFTLVCKNEPSNMQASRHTLRLDSRYSIGAASSTVSRENLLLPNA